ncbi:MAG: hypothetical protein HOP11_03560 [Saprospiraceae bacterium]|nr:hypothetical protein [Saprospiraceae bacterium]
MAFTGRSIYIDAEWYIGGHIFLIGYAYSKYEFGQLYDGALTKEQFLKKLRNVKYIFFYGPDIGIIEKYFDIDLRNRYICVNLLRIFRKVLQLTSFKLAHVEQKFGIVRKQVEYKKNIFAIFNDWKKHDKRKRILKYNEEDVINLLRLWRKVRSRNKITNYYLIQNQLK